MALPQQQAIPIGSLPLLHQSPCLCQPCRQVDHRLSPKLQAVGRLPGMSCERRPPIAKLSSSSRRGPIGYVPGSQHVCRSHLQGSLNYLTTHLDAGVFGKLQLWRAACSLPCSFPLSTPPTRSLAFSSYLCNACWDLSWRSCYSIVSAGAGTPRRWHDVVRRRPAMLFIDVAWFRRAGSTAEFT